jgi:uncharacterized membrane protein
MSKQNTLLIGWIISAGLLMWSFYPRHLVVASDFGSGIISHFYPIYFISVLLAFVLFVSFGVGYLRSQSQKNKTSAS